MNQGKLVVIKHEMSRLSINMLGISELEWTGMGKFNAGDHYIYYCGYYIYYNISIVLYLL